MEFNPLKDRKNQVMIFRSFFLVVLIALCLVFCAKIMNPARFLSYNVNFIKQSPSADACVRDTPSRSQGEAASSPSRLSAQQKELSTYVVKPGDTFLAILSKYGMSSEQAISCCRELKGLELVSLAPGDSLVLTRFAGGAPAGFSLLHRLSDWYSVHLDSAGAITSSKSPAAYSTLRCIAKGELISSLSESMNEIGLDETCVWKFADIFAWDINFFVDPQKGDRYEIIFEKKFLEGRFAGYGDIVAAQYINNGRVFRALGMKDENGAMRYFDPEGKSMQKQFLKAPLRFNHISSRFSHSRMHPILGIVRPHLGVDYAAPAGTPVHASADGIVSFVGNNGGFGNQIRIRHGAAFETSYGHLRAYGKGIRAGKRVAQGDLIGFVGETGQATGPHLDYRMTRNQSFINPSSISLPSGKGVAPEMALEFRELRQECLTLFTLRLPGRTGAWVLDVCENKKAGDPPISFSMK
jgi:murein DD-endopeptidase MepM/ murein hydrolase activator NlpD